MHTLNTGAEHIWLTSSVTS